MRRPVDMGRYAGTAMWVLVALRLGPAGAAALLDRVRSLDGRVGPATLLAALLRLERMALVRSMPTPAGGRAYRLSGFCGEGT